MHRMLLTTALVAAVTGCHTFQPASVDGVAPGESVRVRVTGAFSDSLDTMLPGRGGDARDLEGVLASREGSSLYLDVPVQQELRGMRFETLNQRVLLPRTAVVDIETKQLDRGRTILAGGIVVAVVGAAVAVQLSKESGGGNLPGGPGGPVDAVVSVDFVDAATGVLGLILGR